MFMTTANIHAVVASFTGIVLSLILDLLFFAAVPENFKTKKFVYIITV